MYFLYLNPARENRIFLMEAIFALLPIIFLFYKLFSPDGQQCTVEDADIIGYRKSETRDLRRLQMGDRGLRPETPKFLDGTRDQLSGT